MSVSPYTLFNERYVKATTERQRRYINQGLTIGIFVLPGLLVFLIFLLMPLIQSFQFSLYKWNGLGPLENYQELKNFETLFNDKIFRSAITHSFIIMVLALSIQLPLALSLALIVGRGEMPGRKLFRTILFVPYVFSEVITAIIWLYVLHPNSGLLNNTLSAIIPGYEPIGWLANRDVVLGSIFAVLTWKYFGFHMILYMAGLQAVPKDLEEAARIDGATERQVLRNVTLPLLGSTIRLTVFLSVLGTFQQFVLTWILTEGGPVNASELIGTYLYKYGIQRFSLGYGSAVAVTLFLGSLVFSLGYQRIFMRQDYNIDAS